MPLPAPGHALKVPVFSRKKKEWVLNVACISGSIMMSRAVRSYPEPPRHSISSTQVSTKIGHLCESCSFLPRATFWTPTYLYHPGIWRGSRPVQISTSKIVSLAFWRLSAVTLSSLRRPGHGDGQPRPACRQAFDCAARSWTPPAENRGNLSSW